MASVDSLVCQDCNKRFKTSFLLHQHQRQHTDSRKFRCKLCPKRFILMCQLQLHMRASHSYAPSYSCPVCHRTFLQPAHLRQHMLTHRETFTCHKCDSIFKQRRELSEHILQIHSKKQSCNNHNRKNVSDSNKNLLSKSRKNVKDKLNNTYNPALRIRKRRHSSEAYSESDVQGNLHFKGTNTLKDQLPNQFTIDESNNSVFASSALGIPILTQHQRGTLASTDSLSEVPDMPMDLECDLFRPPNIEDTDICFVSDANANNPFSQYGQKDEDSLTNSAHNIDAADVSNSEIDDDRPSTPKFLCDNLGQCYNNEIAIRSSYDYDSFDKTDEFDLTNDLSIAESVKSNVTSGCMDRPSTPQISSDSPENTADQNEEACHHHTVDDIFQNKCNLSEDNKEVSVVGSENMKVMCVTALEHKIHKLPITSGPVQGKLSVRKKSPKVRLSDSQKQPPESSHICANNGDHLAHDRDIDSECDTSLSLYTPSDSLTTAQTFSACDSLSVDDIPQQEVVKHCDTLLSENCLLNPSRTPRSDLNIDQCQMDSSRANHVNSDNAMSDCDSISGDIENLPLDLAHFDCGELQQTSEMDMNSCGNDVSERPGTPTFALSTVCDTEAEVCDGNKTCDKPLFGQVVVTSDMSRHSVSKPKHTSAWDVFKTEFTFSEAPHTPKFLNHGESKFNLDHLLHDKVCHSDNPDSVSSDVKMPFLQDPFDLKPGTPKMLTDDDASDACCDPSSFTEDCPKLLNIALDTNIAKQTLKDKSEDSLISSNNFIVGKNKPSTQKVSVVSVTDIKKEKIDIQLSHDLTNSGLDCTPSRHTSNKTSASSLPASSTVCQIQKVACNKNNKSIDMKKTPSCSSHQDHSKNKKSSPSESHLNRQQSTKASSATKNQKKSRDIVKSENCLEKSSSRTSVKLSQHLPSKKEISNLSINNHLVTMKATSEHESLDHRNDGSPARASTEKSHSHGSPDLVRRTSPLTHNNNCHANPNSVVKTSSPAHKKHNHGNPDSLIKMSPSTHIKHSHEFVDFLTKTSPSTQSKNRHGNHDSVTKTHPSPDKKISHGNTSLKTNSLSTHGKHSPSKHESVNKMSQHAHIHGNPEIITKTSSHTHQKHMLDLIDNMSPKHEKYSHTSQDLTTKTSSHTHQKHKNKNSVSSKSLKRSFSNGSQYSKNSMKISCSITPDHIHTDHDRTGTSSPPSLGIQSKPKHTLHKSPETQADKFNNNNTKIAAFKTESKLKHSNDVPVKHAIDSTKSRTCLNRSLSVNPAQSVKQDVNENVTFFKDLLKHSVSHSSGPSNAEVMGHSEDKVTYSVSADRKIQVSPKQALHSEYSVEFLKFLQREYTTDEEETAPDSINSGAVSMSMSCIKTEPLDIHEQCITDHKPQVYACGTSDKQEDHQTVGSQVATSGKRTKLHSNINCHVKEEDDDDDGESTRPKRRPKSVSNHRMCPCCVNSDKRPKRIPWQIVHPVTKEQINFVQSSLQLIQLRHRLYSLIYIVFPSLRSILRTVHPDTELVDHLVYDLCSVIKGKGVTGVHCKRSKHSSHAGSNNKVTCPDLTVEIPSPLVTVEDWTSFPSSSEQGSTLLLQCGEKSSLDHTILNQTLVTPTGGTLTAENDVTTNCLDSLQTQFANSYSGSKTSPPITNLNPEGSPNSAKTPDGSHTPVSPRTGKKHRRNIFEAVELFCSNNSKGGHKKGTPDINRTSKSPKHSPDQENCDLIEKPLSVNKICPSPLHNHKVDWQSKTLNLPVITKNLFKRALSEGAVDPSLSGLEAHVHSHVHDNGETPSKASLLSDTLLNSSTPDIVKKSMEDDPLSLSSHSEITLPVTVPYVTAESAIQLPVSHATVNSAFDNSSFVKNSSDSAHSVLVHSCRGVPVMSTLANTDKQGSCLHNIMNMPGCSVVLCESPRSCLSVLQRRVVNLLQMLLPDVRMETFYRADVTDLCLLLDIVSEYNTSA